MSTQQGRYSGKETGGNPGYPAGTKNGQIPECLLRRVRTQGHLPQPFLYNDAATAFDAMTRAAAKDGVILSAVALYRDLAGQRHMREVWTKRGKPGNAAVPGRSSHGWGTAADVDRSRAGVLEWLVKHGPRFGWDHPMWAGSARGPQFGREPWHWQWIRGFVPREEETMPEPEAAPLARLIPGAGAYIEAGVSWVPNLAVVAATGATVEADDQHATFTLAGKAATFEGANYRFRNGHGAVRAGALSLLDVKVTWEQALIVAVKET